MSDPAIRRPRPLSPNIQNYRPQLTSVLSFANRVTGVLLCACAVVLVAWLTAAAAGSEAFAIMQVTLDSWAGRLLLLAGTFTFFLHLCGGIRHLVWDTVHGFELRSIYASGWVVVATSVLLTAIAWVASMYMGG